MPLRALAPDSSYILVTADAWDKSMEAWKKTGLHELMQSEPMLKVFGSEGATGNIDKRVKEIGAPEGSVTWPDAFGLALYTVHNNELDSDEGHVLVYGDWGTRADATAQLIDAILADAVKTDKWRTETGDEIMGRKVTTVVLPEDEAKRAGRQRFGGQFGVEFARNMDKLFYVRDGSRFLISTERGALEDALEAVDGKRKCTLSDQKDYQGAMDQLGSQDLSVVLLTGPMQKALAGASSLALFQPMLQPLFGDVEAWAFGFDVQSPRGQIEVTQTALLPGKRTGVWNLLGPAVPIEAPPPMVGPEAISYARINIQFKEIMNLVNTVAANVPEMGEQLDGFLLSLGPVVTKGLEALGPGVWTYGQIRQPVTPESHVTTTIVACSNPKAVVPMLMQSGFLAGEPRDVDGNTIFDSGASSFSIGVSNGYMATGETKQVEQAMRAVGQKDLPSIAENASFKKASAAAGTEPLLAWGYSDLVARWSYDREMIKLAAKSDNDMTRAVEKSDDSPWAKRVGYQLPKNSLELLAAIEPALLAKHIGPTVWNVKMGDKGLTTRIWLMPGSAETPVPKE